MRRRLEASPQTWNRLARWVITSGGVLLILAVLAIVAFIAREAFPLFGKSHVTAEDSRSPAVRSSALAAGIDDDRDLAFEVHPHATVFFRIADGETITTRPHPFGNGVAATCARFDARRGALVLGSADGRVAYGNAEFDVRWDGEKRVVVPALRWRGTAVLDSTGAGLEDATGDRDEDGRLAFVGRTTPGHVRYVATDESGTPTGRLDLTPQVGSVPATSLLLSLHAALLAVGSADGTVYVWQLGDPAAPHLEDHIRVTPDTITALGLLLGDQTLVAGTSRGDISSWLRVRYVIAKNESEVPVRVDQQMLAPGQEATMLDRDYGRRLGHIPGLRFRTAGQPWTHVHDFGRHPGPIVAIAAGPRGRTFVTADALGHLRLQHATTCRTLVEVVVDGTEPRAPAFAPKGNGLAALSDGQRLHVWGVENPHPETTVASLFRPTWYEGYAEPKHVWQSTGGSDEFEPKLGLVPLLVGTLKGTFYALLFSVPIAVFAALYLSQLASPGLRTAVKPIIELMAAMPSVVVGFLAALWLAPLIESHLGATAGALGGLPLGLVLAVAAWYALPRRMRLAARPGVELAFLVPFLLGAVWAGASAGGPLEAAWFGGDLKQWLFDRHGITYDQRNCIVVGIALGFAIIPIIFTISEDAMAAVPPSLRTAALALGASRWQSALHIVLPAASPGIFAAVMLGLGRAIGETMIVLMATGNTPILDFSPFNGMRTMSAGIAVEIPEAPHGGTLYRVLFLTGFLLFTFTFLLNTVADVVSRRLRKRYGQF